MAKIVDKRIFYMKILQYLYGLILYVLCFGCSTSIEIEQPTISLDKFNLDSEYICVIGDIQEYTGNVVYNTYLDSTMQWLLKAKTLGLKINSILQVGDISAGNREDEWQVFYDYTLPVAQVIPFVACIGNHDYDWDSYSKILSRDETFFTKYVSFPNAKAEIQHKYDGERMENIVVKNNIWGEDYDILVLEFGARWEVVEWADSIVKNNPDKKYILLTHEFLTRAGEIVGSDSYAVNQFVNVSSNSPCQIWDSLVTNNDNIVCVVCGHNGFSKLNLTENSFGREVPSILFNLQYQDNGGNGLIEMWEIKQDCDSINVGVYSILRDEWLSDHDTRFNFKYRY